MFYYYGRKDRISKEYPKPLCDTIVEPFAGSAAYSMRYYDRNVILVEKDPKIASIWKYLIDVTPEEILSLPIIEKGESLNNEKYNFLTEVQKNVIGLFLNPGSAQPKKSPGKFCSWNEKNKIRLSQDVLKVKHWKVINDVYQISPDIVATWYIDPPYQGNGGQYYRFGNKNFDYDELRNWVLERKGQIIVCENSEANWMDFKPLVDIQGQKRKSKEVIFYLENL